MKTPTRVWVQRAASNPLGRRALLEGTTEYPVEMA